MKRIIIFWIIFWLVCSVLSYGIFLKDARSSRIVSCRKDMGFSFTRSILGPISLFVAIGDTGFAEHGLQFTCGEGE